MRELAKETGKKSMEEIYGRPNRVDVCGKGFIKVYHTRASGFRNSKAFCGLISQVLDDAAAGEGAACDGRENNLAHISMCSLPLSFAIPTLLIGRCKVGMSYRNASSVILV
jgi:hypothetical protein